MPPVKGQQPARATAGATFALHVIPNARQNDLTDGWVKTLPQRPKMARPAPPVTELLAQAQGAAESWPSLIRSATIRHKLFHLD